MCKYIYSALAIITTSLNCMNETNFNTKNRENADDRLLKLKKAFTNDDAETIQELLSNINEQDNNKFSLLTYAVIEHNYAAAKFLIANGAFIDNQDIYGNTPLMYAVRRHKKPFIALLLQSGANINLQDKQGRTCLMEASDSLDREIVQILIENGASKDIKDNYGQTALDIYNYRITSNKEIMKSIDEQRKCNGNE